MKATYWDFEARSEAVVLVNSRSDLDDLRRQLSAIKTVDGGGPTAELEHENGATLSVATDGTRALLVWVDPLGESFSSQGGTCTDSMVFDFRDHYSEAPAAALVGIDDAMECVWAFVTYGSPVIDNVLFVPD